MLYFLKFIVNLLFTLCITLAVLTSFDKTKELALKLAYNTALVIGVIVGCVYNLFRRKG